MGYILGQYNKSSNSTDDKLFMSLIKEGTPKRRSGSVDSGVTGNAFDPFVDECLTMNDSFATSKSYYFHGKIKRLVSDQVFYVKLINYDDTSTVKTEQYLNTLTVQGGNTSEWVDVELVFTPLTSFDTIVFELQRTAEDYRTETRYPVIIYEELSIINNIIGQKIVGSVKLLKMGVQSRPGLMMCINGEEIHVGRSGIYEVKNGVILVTFFSVVAPATETSIDIIGLEKELSALSDNLTENEKKETIMSKSILNEDKDRNISAFTLDYMFEEEA